MPTYQYICTECEHSFEVTQAFTDSTVPTCPGCNGIVRKVFSSVGVVFKGSGFYRTDSRGAATSTSPPPATSTPVATSTPTPSTPSTPAPTSTPTAPSTGTK
ncbi:MAG: FmdB family transcriptional regulator [Candidatus Nanopelagicaceae bacterium]|nr:FmdB family transcriptional regulator [Candidatus Nanopelagicaceae bacterium]